MTVPIASPSTRAFARKHGVDLVELQREIGREEISRGDVAQKIADAANAAPRFGALSGPAWEVDHAAFGPVREEPLSRFMQVGAANLVAAQQQIPAVTNHDRVDMEAVENFRARVKSKAEARGVKLNALSFHVMALSQTLREFPRFNASLDSAGKILIIKDYVHIGVAVDTPHGLLVPVVREADRKGLWRIAEEIADLAARAQARKLRPAEMGGASMSITNIGGIGGSAFTPIINPPELAILGIARAEMAPVWNGSEFKARLMAPLDLSYDHRVINGADAARFLVRYSALIGDPRRMLL